MQLQFNTNPREDTPTCPASVDLSSEDALRAISRFDPIGLWRMDMETGLVYWTEAVFEIHGIAVKDGPVDWAASIDAYHPDDRDIVFKCMEETIKNKTGFRFVLRLRGRDGDFFWVKSTGLYRQTDSGAEEIYGYLEKFSAVARSVTILNNSS